VRSAWQSLAAQRHEVGRRGRELTLHGAAQLAGAMLGTRADWIVKPDRPADYRYDDVSDGSFVDDAWDVTGPCRETWDLHEQRDGDRGVQLLAVTSGTIEGRPEGGGVNVVRIFDGARAASVTLSSNNVSTVGAIDLAPLDLYRAGQGFTVDAAVPEVDMLRALVAQLAGELDAHYDTSPAWPSADGLTFRDGERAVELRHNNWYPRSMIAVHGLPWGHQLDIYLQDGRGSLGVQLPDADIDRVFARLATIAKPGD
jgi:hypothetical protein